MEAMLLLTALGGGAYWLGRKLWDAASAAGKAREKRRRAEAAWAGRMAAIERERAASEKRLNALARNFQLALLGLRSAHDFRRAASWATHASSVPLAFRQRQFRRFRPLFVSHFADRLAAGEDAETLLESLRALVEALGVAPFEADYIRTEAVRVVAASRLPARVPYADRLLQLQAEHETRLQALRDMALQSETREQLLEAEEARFREALQTLTVADPSPALEPQRRSP